ncbi:dUTP diphosphatase [Halobacillus karajensis]|uniref:dUTPase n=1 Tax=Halobacillus karajensis TaxID=195088 RepID=A0A059NXS8_9BACI|nr:dUTP diphosphatase [Halobacillus karajensis]CDQ22596.1 dUTPase [Halobacillus karajensis]CDQ26078.1 dUTPase [Halobacillus karajensis]
METNVDWQTVFQMQRKLTQHIAENYPVQDGEDRVKKKAFALMTEVAECGNEEKSCFKFWKANPIPNHEEMLEEHVDIVHFVADIGIEMGIKDYKLKPVKEDVLGLFAGTMYLAYLLAYGKFNVFDDLISSVDELGGKLGFTPEDIARAHKRKNEINYSRQASGY